MNTNYGLRPLKEDERDFPVGGLVDLPELSELPKKYSLPLPKIKDQKQSDFCAAFSSTTVSEYQEGVELCPEWVFAIGKMLAGDVDDWGIDLRTICKAHEKYGAIEVKDAPFSIDNKDADFLRRIENWPDELKDKALYHKKASYFKVVGPYDSFDDIRATLWKFREEKRAVFTGVVWSWNAKDFRLDDFNMEGYGHAVPVIGWDGDYAIVPNSWGKKVGDNGVHYIHRRVINKFVGMYGAFMFLDITKEEATEYLKYGRKLEPIKLSLIQTILNLANKLVEILKKKDMSKQERFLALCKSKIGTDFTPDYPVPDEVSCALAVTTLLRQIDSTIPIITGTWALDDYLKTSGKFKRVEEPVGEIKPGSIVCSPTGQGNGNVVGHTGVYFDNDRIISNSSITGLWETNYNRTTWRNRYSFKGGLPIRIYELVD